jgi:enoyl-CoA hydratase/carnithine racemase
MKIYRREQCEQLDNYHFAFIKWTITDHVLRLLIDRPEKKNALHPQLVNELALLLQYAHDQTEIWMVLISAVGNVFCAGADLKAMAGIIEENDSTVPLPEKDILIANLFSAVHKPIISKITGDVYAGGFFFLAGSQIVISQDDVKFGLPEVKRGLYPFQVMAALLKVMPARRVIDWCIRGYNLPVSEAVAYGLVTEMCNASEIDERVEIIIHQLKQNSPSAIRLGLEAYQHIAGNADDQTYLFDMLQKTILSADGVEGLRAFREKRAAQWTGK